MERLHVHVVRDVIHRLRQGQSQRAVARDLRLSRLTVQKYARWAEETGFLDPTVALPEIDRFLEALGPLPKPPAPPSTLEPYRATVEQLLGAGVEMMTIFDRLREQHGYTGSYSSVRRFVRRLAPAEPRVVVRVHTAPGEQAQSLS